MTTVLTTFAAPDSKGVPYMVSIWMDKHSPEVNFTVTLDGVTHNRKGYSSIASAKRAAKHFVSNH